eukprot:231594-Pyramimonas_sp.AAC.1
MLAAARAPASGSTRQPRVGGPMACASASLSNAPARRRARPPQGGQDVPRPRAQRHHRQEKP